MDGDPVAAKQLSDDIRDASIVIWTTTPWTIPGNRAISFSPKIEYGLYEVTDAPADNWAKLGDKFVLAEKLAVEALRQARVTAFRQLASLPVRSDRRDHLPSSAEKGQRWLRFPSAAARRRPRHATTPAPASCTRRRATAARTSISGRRMRPSSQRAASTP